MSFPAVQWDIGTPSSFGKVRSNFQHLKKAPEVKTADFNVGKMKLIHRSSKRGSNLFSMQEGVCVHWKSGLEDCEISLLERSGVCQEKTEEEKRKREGVHLFNFHCTVSFLVLLLHGFSSKHTDHLLLPSCSAHSESHLEPLGWKGPQRSSQFWGFYRFWGIFCMCCFLLLFVCLVCFTLVCLQEQHLRKI